MDSIKKLLTHITKHNSNDVFKKVASKLINEFSLSINNDDYSFTELEFYYYSASHPDPYVHLHKRQKEFGKFYVHRKAGNYGGIDLTLGDSSNKVFCGVLIRGIKDDKGFISGPNLVKKHIYQLLQVNDIDELQDCINDKIIFAKKPIKNEQIYVSTRIGLKPKFEDYLHNGLYIYKLHRFIAYNCKDHPFKEKINVMNYNKTLNNKFENISPHPACPIDG